VGRSVALASEGEPVSDNSRRPDLSFIVPVASENRWSDLLATMVATDPEPMGRLIGAAPDEVRREALGRSAAHGRADRLDLLLLRKGTPLAAIEVKLLADLGVRQLDRYAAAFPEVERRFVLHLAGLPLSLRAAPGWLPLTWESVLRAYAAHSHHDWVRATAVAWLDALDSLLPKVDSQTVWNDVPDDAAAFELALRVRMVWLARRMDDWCQLDHELSLSSGGGVWVAAMRAEASPATRHRVIAELQEAMDPRSWRRDSSRPYRSRLTGPVILVGLSQSEVSSSAGFDWSLLHAIFKQRVVSPSGEILDGRDWQTTSAGPRNPTDRANWLTMVADGAPPWLGKGYGMATARSHGVCAFGARVQLRPDLTLGEIDTNLRSFQDLVVTMASSMAALERTPRRGNGADNDE
jgi:hypothetical protein